MALPTAAEAAQAWVEGMGRAAAKITRGVDRVTEAPGQKAAAVADYWQQQVSMMETKDKFRRNVGAVSLESWKQDMKQRGIGRVASGAQQSQTKMARFLEQFLPFLDGVLAQVRSMPRGDVEQNIARSAALIRGLARFRKS